MDIFGNSKNSGFLKNPLDTDLEGADFNIYDVNELHLNELHDQDGSGPIVVHERLNMTNKTIGNLADPVAAKDAVTLSYYESNFPAQIQYYDLYAAFTDETTPISVGFQPLQLFVPRAFTCSDYQAFLSTGASVNNYVVSQLRLNGTTIPQSAGQYADFATAGDKVSTTGYFTAGDLNLVAGDILTVYMNADTTAAGLKLVFRGTI